MNAHSRKHTTSQFKGLLVAALMFNVNIAFAQPGISATPTSFEAQSLVQSYFEALQFGDLDQLSLIFAPRERQRIKSQLNDPTYSQFLIDRYRNAQFEVIGYSTRSNFQVVDVRIRLNNIEAITERLFLKQIDGANRLWIVSRGEIQR